MIYTSLANAHIKRTIRPLGFTQTTPKAQFLDPAWDRSTDIYPGMVMMRKGGDLVSLIDGTGFPMGLAALYVGGDGVDEVANAGVNAMTVWVLGPDAEFEVLAPAFDDTATWTDPTDGTTLLVHAVTTGAKRGKLCPAGAANASTRPVAKLLKVASTKKIVIGGLQGTSAS